MSKLTSRMKRRIKSEFGAEKPTIWIGKKQISNELMKEIEKQLEKRKIVKIKILKSALQEAKAYEIASTISKQTEADLVEVRGHTFILYKRRRKISKE
ncbi:MAG: YhbY family RNA-binding protein [Candidatus Bathyarchaeia archaeon]